MIGERLDLTGEIMGKWKVGERVIGKNGKSYFDCECLNCGTRRLVKGTALASGASRSCGCMTTSKEAIAKRQQTLHDKKIMIDHTSVSLLKKICRGELMSNNTSGCTGVSQKGNKWVAEIRCQGKYHYLGIWDTYEEAVIARQKGEEIYFGKILTSV